MTSGIATMPMTDRMREIADSIEQDGQLGAANDLRDIAAYCDETRLKFEPLVEVTRHTQQSSASIDRTSTGKHSISIKVYDDDPEAALNKAIELLAKAEAKIAAQADGDS